MRRHLSELRRALRDILAQFAYTTHLDALTRQHRSVSERGPNGRERT